MVLGKELVWILVPQDPGLKTDCVYYLFPGSCQDPLRGSLGGHVRFFYMRMAGDCVCQRNRQCFVELHVYHYSDERERKLRLTTL